MKEVRQPDERAQLNFIIENLNLGIGFRVGRIQGEPVTAIVYTIGIEGADGETEYEQECLAVLANPTLLKLLEFENQIQEVTNAS